MWCCPVQAQVSWCQKWSNTNLVGWVPAQPRANFFCTTSRVLGVLKVVSVRYKDFAFLAFVFHVIKRNLVVAGLPYPNQGSGLEESLPVLQLCREHQQFCNNCAHVILSFGNQQCIYTVRVLLCAYFTGVGCCIFSSAPHATLHGSLPTHFFFALAFFY